ncbi:chymotrypsin-1-like, partial [Pogonomyrmex barbatus]|uniref:Chymotrypsin-1-like n=1 Tax=Pogonomyrmex barbatus TaxID=144034 RepID=A0A6I9WUA3_9HYME
LAEPIEFNTKQKPIKLPKTDLEKNDDVTTVAWGSTGFKENVHDDLQKLKAQVMLAKDCQIYHTFMRIHSQEFCTFIKVGTGACNGDSGSGIIRNSDNTLVGLISGGMPCARGYPDVYTTIYPYKSWIEEIMSK